MKSIAKRLVKAGHPDLAKELGSVVNGRFHVFADTNKVAYDLLMNYQKMVVRPISDDLSKVTKAFAASTSQLRELDKQGMGPQIAAPDLLGAPAEEIKNLYRHAEKILQNLEKLTGNKYR